MKLRIHDYDFLSIGPEGLGSGIKGLGGFSGKVSFGGVSGSGSFGGLSGKIGKTNFTRKKGFTIHNAMYLFIIFII